MDNYVMFPPHPDLAQEVQRMQGTLSRLEKFLAAQDEKIHKAEEYGFIHERLPNQPMVSKDEAAAILCVSPRHLQRIRKRLVLEMEEGRSRNPLLPEGTCGGYRKVPMSLESGGIRESNETCNPITPDIDMTVLEKRAILSDFRAIIDDLRAEIKCEIRREIKEASKEIYAVLTNQGIIEPEERVLTKAQLMEMYNVGKTKIESMMADGTLPFIKSGDSRQSRVTFRWADARIAFETTRR